MNQPFLVVVNYKWLLEEGSHHKRLTNQHLCPVGASARHLADGCRLLVKNRSSNGTVSIDSDAKLVRLKEEFFIKSSTLSTHILDETTLSQCNTFLIFRLVNPRDQSFVEKVMENLTKADSRLLPGFGPGQGIVSGQAVRFPLVIQVDFDDDLLTPALGNEDFLEQARDWQESDESEATARSDELIAQLHAAAQGTDDSDA